MEVGERRVRRKQLSPVELGMILQQILDGKNDSEIGRQYGRDQKTIWKIRKKYEAHGSVEQR